MTDSLRPVLGELIEEIREKLATITPGEWRAENAAAPPHEAWGVSAYERDEGVSVVLHDFVGPSDARFIAAAPRLLRAALDLLISLSQEHEKEHDDMSLGSTAGEDSQGPSPVDPAVEDAPVILPRSDKSSLRELYKRPEFQRAWKKALADELSEAQQEIERKNGLLEERRLQLQVHAFAQQQARERVKALEAAIEPFRRFTPIDWDTNPDAKTHPCNYTNCPECMKYNHQPHDENCQIGRLAALLAPPSQPTPEAK